MTTTVLRRYRFEAAHRLPWHAGKCRNVHGHSYILEVAVTGPLDERGVVLDFAEVDEVVLSQVVERLDHVDLNTVLENPTAELLVHWIAAKLSEAALPWTSLRLWETEDGSVYIER